MIYTREELEDFAQKLEEAIKNKVSNEGKSKSILKEKLNDIKALIKQENILSLDIMDSLQGVAIIAGLNLITLKKEREPFV